MSISTDLIEVQRQIREAVAAVAVVDPVRYKEHLDALYSREAQLRAELEGRKVK